MKPHHTSTAATSPVISLLITGAVLSMLTLQGCNSPGGEYATNEFASRAIMETDLRKQKAREAARKREEERLARKKVRRAATEKVGWLALSELQKHKERARCYSADIRNLEARLKLPTKGESPTSEVVSKPLPGASGHYGSESSGGEGSGGDRGC